MSRRGQIAHKSSGRVLVPSVRWCASFFCRLRGLMFRRALDPGEGLLLVEARASRGAAAIHMMFVSFPIAAIWLDDEFRVVDKVLAQPWRLYYAPSIPARYTLEAHATMVDEIATGDQLEFLDVMA